MNGFTNLSGKIKPTEECYTKNYGTGLNTGNDL
jgi:hypothetical protein